MAEPYDEIDRLRASLAERDRELEKERDLRVECRKVRKALVRRVDALVAERDAARAALARLQQEER